MNYEGHLVTVNNPEYKDSYLVLFHVGDVLTAVGVTYQCPVYLDANYLATNQIASREVIKHILNGMGPANSSKPRVYQLLDRAKSESKSVFVELKELLLDLPVIRMFARYKSNAQLQAENPDYDYATDQPKAGFYEYETGIESEFAQQKFDDDAKKRLTLRTDDV